MAVLRPERHVGTGSVVELVVPGARHEREFLSLVARSAELHGGWVQAPASPAAYARYLRRIASHDHCGFFARVLATGEIAGVVNLNDIRMGGALNASLGYYGLVPAHGGGRMTEAVRLATDHAFSKLGLHRVEANIQPGNARSRALVGRLGFRLEGFSPRFLFIAGDWRDHERWAVLRDEWVAR
jgi:[ribosomal protein S5]-alanine N-acetyltransferase